MLSPIVPQVGRPPNTFSIKPIYPGLVGMVLFSTERADRPLAFKATASPVKGDGACMITLTLARVYPNTLFKPKSSDTNSVNLSHRVFLAFAVGWANSSSPCVRRSTFSIVSVAVKNCSVPDLYGISLSKFWNFSFVNASATNSSRLVKPYSFRVVRLANSYSAVSSVTAFCCCGVSLL